MRAVRRLTEEGVLKIIDFGLSHVYPRTAGGAVDRSTPLLAEYAGQAMQGGGVGAERLQIPALINAAWPFKRA